MTALTKTKCSIISWEVEDYLTEKMVFLNGFRETDEATYTKDEWLKCIDAWHGHAYLAPTFELLARFVEYLVKNKFGE